MYFIANLLIFRLWRQADGDVAESTKSRYMDDRIIIMNTMDTSIANSSDIRVRYGEDFSYVKRARNMAFKKD
jgi:hypothetical protein